jgi:hypothetical protein
MEATVLANQTRPRSSILGSSSMKGGSVLGRLEVRPYPISAYIRYACMTKSPYVQRLLEGLEKGSELLKAADEWDPMIILDSGGGSSLPRTVFVLWYWRVFMNGVKCLAFCTVYVAHL